MSRPARASLQFRCPQCMTLLGARARHAGTQRRCPACHAVFQVPTKEEIRARGARIKATGAYNLTTGTAGEAASKVYIPVRCPVCGTGLYATSEEVGTELTCPDCEAHVTVPPLATAPADEGPSPEELAKRQEEYNILDDGAQPSPELQEDYQRYFGLKCSVCGTRLLATEDQVGQQIDCPDCGRQTMVRAPEPAPPAAAWEIDRTDEYHSGPVPEAPDYAPLVDDVIERGQQRFEEEEQWERERARWEPPPARRPPPWLFRTGIVRFLGDDQIRNRWVLITVALVGIVWMFHEGQVLWGSPNVTVHFLGLAVMALALSGSFVAVPLIFPILLAIVQETAEGADEISEWPDMEWIDAIIESLYLFTAGAVSGLPGTLLASSLKPDPLTFTIIVYGSAMLLFPFTLLGALESGSPFTPFSIDVLLGIPSTWRAWLRFYVKSTALLAAALAVSVVAVMWGKIFGILLVTVLFVPVLMVYFRLLGRLAWFTSDRSLDETSQPPWDRAGGPPPAAANKTRAKPQAPPEAEAGWREEDAPT